MNEETNAVLWQPAKLGQVVNKLSLRLTECGDIGIPLICLMKHS